MIGIYMMWFAALVSGFGALGMSIAYVIRPTERKLALMRPLSLASIFAAVCSFTHGLATVLRRSADPNSHPILKRLAGCRRRRRSLSVAAGALAESRPLRSDELDRFRNSGRGSGGHPVVAVVPGMARALVGSDAGA